jgi:hypothetical protein
MPHTENGQRDPRALPQLGDEERGAAAEPLAALADGTLAAAHKGGLGFPTLPQLRPTVPEPTSSCRCWTTTGARLPAGDGSGVAAKAPPPIRQVLAMLAPKVDADGNELGGVPVVLRDAPLGTYLGWNITAGGAPALPPGADLQLRGRHGPVRAHRGERQAERRPAPSLEERYRSHDGLRRSRAQGGRPRAWKPAS